MMNDQAAQDSKTGQELVHDFCLPDMKGRLVSSEYLRKKGAIVVILCVGGLCPVNSITLLRFLKVLSRLEATGASLVAISCEKSNEYQQISEQSNSFHFLLDTNNQLIGQVSEKAQATNFPAIFAMCSEGEVLFSSLASKDTTKRILPKDVIGTLPISSLANDATPPSSTATASPKASKPARRTFRKLFSFSKSEVD
jgi:peroxiredoxin